MYYSDYNRPPEEREPVIETDQYHVYEAQPPRGEYVLVVEGAAAPAAPELTLEGALALVRERIEAGGSKKDAVRQVSAETGFPKNQLYDAVLKL